MCGRFNIIDDKGMRDLLRALGLEFNFPTRINIAPTEAVPVILQGDHGLTVHEMRWWLTPSWAPEVSTRFSMFNARSETIATSKAFRGPFRHKRGIMPASSFIEWQSSGNHKQPWLIRPPEGVLAFAAIWDQWEKADSYIESCAMVTTDAAASINWLHHRMPVMLPQEDIMRWLDPATPLAQLQELMGRGLVQALEAVPLSTAVNSGRDKRAELLAPAGEAVAIPPAPNPPRKSP